jgi:hypothetical protein
VTTTSNHAGPKISVLCLAKGGHQHSMWLEDSYPCPPFLNTVVFKRLRIFMFCLSVKSPVNNPVTSILFLSRDSKSLDSLFGDL